MSNNEPVSGRCNAQTRDGNHCANYPVKGANRCRQHGGTNDGPDPAKLEGNQNARTHGVHADPANVLDDLADRDPDAYEWVMSKYDSYLDASPFDDGSAKADLLKQIATQEYTIWKATGHQLRNGVVRQTDDGMEESPVNLPLDRMQRTVTRRLERLGALDYDDSDSGDSEKTLCEILSEE
jgi:phage-related protein